MKILVISSFSESLVNFRGDMLKAFRENGHDVYTLGPDYRADISKILSDWSISYDTYYLERTGTNLFKDIQSYYTLKNKINEIKPDLVLSYTIKPVIYGSLAAKAVGIDAVYAMITGLGSAFNNYETLKTVLLSKLTSFLYRVGLKDIDGVLFQNPDDRKVFLEKNLVTHNNSYRIHGSGININTFSYKAPVTDPVRFLFIGRLLKEKGILDFVEAAKSIKKKYPTVEFDIVGSVDGNPSTVKKETVEEWVNKGIVKHHGWVEDVKPYIEKSSVFVLPSYREGTPRTGLECMAMGRPLVMTDVPGCRETVKEGENGYLVPVKDSKSLAVAMKKFIESPDLIKKMGKKSREFAEEVYDVDKVNKDIINILGL